MAERLARQLLLIGWDAADWRVINPLLDSGKMPQLQRLLERGVMGNIATLHPVLSPMLWTSIATGKRPYEHGVLGFVEPTPDGAGVRPVSTLSRKTKAFWNILHQNGLTTNVVGWWPSAPVEPIRGVMVSNHFQRAVGPPGKPWPLRPGTIHPPRLVDRLKELRFHPSELVEEQVAAFVPRAREIDQDEDRRLAGCMKTLAECASIHAASTAVMADEPWDVMAVYHDAIDHFCHGFMRYHPPRQAWISEHDFQLYSGVVEAAYRFHDMMLGALLHQAGDGVHVILCSDHGFHPDHNRPADIPQEPAGPAVEHRDSGILVMAGPGLRQDELVHGATLLDIVPTLLTLLGLPVGEDMDGKPLAQAFERPPRIETVPSWDDVPGEAGEHDPRQQGDPLEFQAAIDQLVELGYIEKLDADREKAVAAATIELRFNLARSYMDGDRHAEAVPILDALYEAAPDQHRFGLQLALCYRALGRVDRLRPLVDTLHERRLDSAAQAQKDLEAFVEEVRGRQTDGEGEPVLAERMSEEERKRVVSLRGRAAIRAYDVAYLRGYVAAAEGDHEAALRHLAEAERAEPRRPGLHLQIGESYLALRRWDAAERAFERALEIDTENPHARLGLARCHLRRGRSARAAEEALTAVGLRYHFPLAHFVLGQALAQMGRYEPAAEAFEVAVALNANFARAHLRLAQIYDRRLERPGDAMIHRALVREIRRQARRARDRRRQPVTVEPPGAAVHLSASAAPGDDTPVATVVTGLPRSGTSMMMQMLAAGGLPSFTDGRRAPDEDNPRGYHELEAAARLRTDASWVPDAVGKCVKVVAPLLHRLPASVPYRVVFMQRDLEEVLASQRAMLERRGRRASRSATELTRAYGQQLHRARGWLERRGVPAIFVDYRRALDDPEGTAAAVASFLGGALDAAAMARTIEPMLHRQRRGG